MSNSNMNLYENEMGRGQCLRQAREAAGLLLEDVASRLHMPVHVVRALEQDDWKRLGAPVFVRGQLRSYAKFLGVDLEPLLEQSPLSAVEPVKLVSHTHTPRLRRLIDYTMRRAVYVIMTGVLAVPVWYATRAHFDGVAPSTASLDVVPSEQVPAAADSQDVSGAEKAAQATTPYIASITAVPRPDSSPTQAVVASNAIGLSLHFSGDSWVQIAAPDGSVIEKALIKSGETRSYVSGQVGRVVLGNAAAVEVQQAGTIVDVKPYQRGNVARFAVSSDGSVVPASE